MKYQVVYGKHIDRKRLLKIPKNERERIFFMIEEKLCTRPDIYGKPLHYPLFRYWSLRVGEYRVIYWIEKTSVHIELIGQRSTIYGEAKKWLA